ncbi:DUF4166 domain-containing protein [Variovorax arabinosiphilus]|uniref:DUF4166 domain-containing protein n=1 Tax=Variovorax arabinosiphilus TaxID=3053498 RepID=UPI00257760EF|nr:MULTISPECIES: DUF4166 domain-containing protein [unclassified Variovorax]MDM0120034.1 DUF4166 domain-containing protein [Variovorax sp. J2L1-78]MDM0128053.1 DUF4166 domain-containing protein [Variovorax sp. J2L1-63]MDM0231753.1 DUF4166 domain-containing protein [Variovorax sp. J2R1-6]
MTLSLYATLMGAAFTELAPAVREFHSSAGRVAFDGWAETAEPQTRVARSIARLLGTPQRRGRHAIRFELDARPATETWTRYFPGRTMRSRMGGHGGDLVEQLGPLRLHFGLAAQEGALVMQLRRVRCFGVPCPRWLTPRVHAVETGIGRELHFDVRGGLPGIGTVAAYRGHLDLSTARPVP